MSLFSPNTTRLEHLPSQDVPGWVNAKFDQLDKSDDGKTRLACSADGEWSLARTIIADADAMDDQTLKLETTRAYLRLLEKLETTTAPHPVRGWNAIPSIGRSNRQGYDRYMSFNAGRHEAYRSFFKSTQSFTTRLPTASAVGHDGADLSISLLGYRAPGRAIENPRQVPAFRYSARYGPTPPSFVRATVLPPVDGQRRVLVAGTASVVGEDSKHAGDLAMQIHETYRNLAAVLYAVDGDMADQGTKTSVQIKSALSQYRSARVYVRAGEDMDAVADSIRQMMVGLESLELVEADICRPELLVEIEGVAMMPDGEVK